MDRIEREIATIVDEWFQGEPTPERQQNIRRTTLINDLTVYARRLREEFFSSNRTIHALEGRLAEVRAVVAEEIAQDALSRDEALNGLTWQQKTALIARQHAKES